MTYGRWIGLVLGTVAFITGTILAVTPITVDGSADCGTVLTPRFDDGLAPIPELLAEPTPEILAERLQHSARMGIRCRDTREIRTYVAGGVTVVGVVLLLASGPRSTRQG